MGNIRYGIVVGALAAITIEVTQHLGVPMAGIIFVLVSTTTVLTLEVIKKWDSIILSLSSKSAQPSPELKRFRDGEYSKKGTLEHFTNQEAIVSVTLAAVVLIGYSIYKSYPYAALGTTSALLAYFTFCITSKKSTNNSDQ